LSSRNGGGPSKRGDETVTAELEWSEAGVVEEGKMATYISKKTEWREVGGQPPLPCTPPRIKTGDEIHLPFRVASVYQSVTANCIRASVLADTTHEWCQEIECHRDPSNCTLR